MSSSDETRDSLKQVLRAFASSVSPADRAEAERTIRRKDAINRFTKYAELLNAAIRAGDPKAAEEIVRDPARFGDLVRHVEGLWTDSVEAFFRARHSTALFLAIVVLEETGKVGVLRFVMALAAAKASGPALEPYKAARSQNPLYSHRRKHLLAAGAGALVNSRLDRVLGEDAVVAFLERVEAGEIEQLRQACLYAEGRHDGFYIPDEHISEADAKHYVILSGEIMAEVLGWEPADFERLIQRVSAVEIRLGLDPELVEP